MLYSAGLKSRLVSVKACLAIGKKYMIHNTYQPHMEVDPQTYEVRAYREFLTCDSASVLPTAQRYFLF
ncbi:hypothetical protein [uncultured Desulfobacter sp.]|uniref:hypothetical protein n=1 Tax=uncultured Desulfobacter sp. TaxID=240139 RepID=UPI0029F501B3|nr:hypothetical protein [uncultured Desulfobacter sp.]